MTTSLATVLHDAADHALAVGPLRVDDVVRAAREQYPDVFDEHAERLVRLAAGNILRAYLRQITRSHDQLAFPTLHMPSAIAVRDEDGEVSYVALQNARWSDLIAGRKERVANVEAAHAFLQDYNNALRQLRRIMQPNPEMTVAEALEVLGRQEAS